MTERSEGNERNEGGPESVPEGSIPILLNTEKQGESGENIDKHGNTGRIRGKHRKTRENRQNQGKT